jgi:thioesterase domain-containing protein
VTHRFQSVGSGQALVVLPSFGLDLPGTGASPPGVPRSDAVADEVVATIGAELGDEPFAILGWSYGGYLAAGVARRLHRQISGLKGPTTGSSA